jgi:hypothetical protein
MVRCCTTGAWGLGHCLAQHLGGGGRDRRRPPRARAGRVCRAAQRHLRGLPQRKHMPLRVRMWIDYLKHHYNQPDFFRLGVDL